MIKHYFTEKFLKNEEVDSLRNALEKFNEKDLIEINNLEEFSKYKELYKYIINKNFLEKIKSNLNLEDFIFLNRINIQKNYIIYAPNVNWHKDSGKKIQTQIISKKGNAYYKIGVFLQENDKINGGGIDILKPLFFDNLNESNFFKNLIRKIYYFIKIRFGNNFLKTNKGDILGFGGLVFHRTTPRVNKKIKEIKNRYSLYFLIGNLNILKDVNKINNSQNLDDDINNHIKEIEFENLIIKSCTKEFTEISEKILSD